MDESSLMLIISPLIALMEEQVAYTKSLGISAVYVGTITSIERQQVIQGLYQVLYMSLSP